MAIGAICGWWPWWSVAATFGISFAVVLLLLCIVSSAGNPVVKHGQE